MNMKKIIIATAIISIAVLAQEVDIAQISNVILEEQIREQSCTLTEHELIGLSISILKKSNTSYDSFKETFDSSRRLVAALKVLVEHGGEADKIYKEFELEKHGVNFGTWSEYYSKKYTTKEKIADLEKLIPENEDSFFRMISSSFKSPAERWLLARKILKDYDSHHKNDVDVSDEIKVGDWWMEKLKTRIPDKDYRRKICKHLVAINIRSLKFGRQYEEPLRTKLQTKEKINE